MPAAVKIWPNIGLDQLPAFARELVPLLPTPAVVLLEGELGAGKTTLVQHFALALGDDIALSPTYSLINQMGEITHADFYRLKSADEIVHLELSLFDSSDYFLIEWGSAYLSEIVRELGQQKSYYRLKIDIADDRREYALYSIGDF